MTQSFTRRCDECKTPLAGRRGHGFVSASGRKVRCSLDTDECDSRKRRLLAPLKRRVEGVASPTGAT